MITKPSCQLTVMQSFHDHILVSIRVAGWAHACPSLRSGFSLVHSTGEIARLETVITRTVGCGMQQSH